MEKLVQIQKIFKSFGAVKAVDGVTLDIQKGEFFSLLGPSGCGKTTLLRLIAGFEKPNSGELLIDNKAMYDMIQQEGASSRTGATFFSAAYAA